MTSLHVMSWRMYLSLGKKLGYLSQVKNTDTPVRCGRIYSIVSMEGMSERMNGFSVVFSYRSSMCQVSMFTSPRSILTPGQPVWHDPTWVRIHYFQTWRAFSNSFVTKIIIQLLYIIQELLQLHVPQFWKGHLHHQLHRFHAEDKTKN